ncbi:MAG: hypothetical protein KDA88_02870 [Planctomycetaceae bacterium]|nr:hypothetical protein [Planctomycetaceae bacterium]
MTILKKLLIPVLLVCCAFHVVPTVAAAANEGQIKASIDRGVAFLRAQFKGAPDEHKGLIGLTLMKAGQPHDAPEIKEAIRLAREKCKDGQYRAEREHFYEAGVDATLLADSGEECKAELQAIANFIISNQNPNGGWNYPGQGESVAAGDTSTMQYCCLALWAADRTGVEIDPQVWVKAIQWHAAYQGADGGFSYRPGTTQGDVNGVATLNMTVNSIGSIHICMLHLDPTSVPFLERPAAAAPNSNEPPKPKGALEVVELQTTPENEPVAIPASAKPTIMKSLGWVASRFRVANESPHNKMYYYYSLERMAALANIKKIGSHDWFNECADYVISRQKQDGSWAESTHVTRTPEIQSCFAVLFLTRSTEKVLKKTAPSYYGNGLLAGGRGLPDDLSSGSFNGRSMEEKKKPPGPLDELLASLANAGEIDVNEVQEQIVEKVQVGDRSELVKQKDLLVKLVKHQDSSVRMMAMWALGRTDDMRLTQHLIEGLDDVDLGVMIEARNALCWLARKPRGFGFAEDPLDALGPNPAPEAKTQAIRDWNKGVVTAWGNWYLENRPYVDRGDQFEAKLRRRLLQIKEEL